MLWLFIKHCLIKLWTLYDMQWRREDLAGHISIVMQWKRDGVASVCSVQELHHLNNDHKCCLAGEGCEWLRQTRVGGNGNTHSLKPSIICLKRQMHTHSVCERVQAACIDPVCFCFKFGQLFHFLSTCFIWLVKCNFDKTWKCRQSDNQCQGHGRPF